MAGAKVPYIRISCFRCGAVVVGVRCRTMYKAVCGSRSLLCLQTKVVRVVYGWLLVVGGDYACK